MFDTEWKSASFYVVTAVRGLFLFKLSGSQTIILQLHSNLSFFGEHFLAELQFWDNNARRNITFSNILSKCT